MKKALIIGLDNYDWAPLKGCVNDANAMQQLLERHEDGKLNFDCQKIISGERKITKKDLKRQIHQLFYNQAEVVLLYFSGHGGETVTGSVLVTEDGEKFSEGVLMNEVMIMANHSKAQQVIIILDCCHSGHLGNSPLTSNNVALLREGVTIITSSADYQVSKERGGQGVFTKMICEALNGEAADLLGNVDLAGIYRYSEKALSSWEQRPVFKSHVSTMPLIRKCNPKLSPEILRKFPNYFVTPDAVHPLDSEYEPSKLNCKTEKVNIFIELQKCNSAGLVVPIDEDHMYFAAVRSKGCKLTNLGQYYWKLVKKGRI